MIRVLSDADVERVLDLEELLPVVDDAFCAQYRGAVERPDRPHFPVGFDPVADPTDAAEDAAGVGLTMPAYIHGRDVFATKLVTVHDENPTRGLPTVNAQIAVTNANDGNLEALLHGARITNARTGCIGGLAARALTTGPVTVGIVGAGTQARWQARAIATATEVERIYVYSPSDSREQCAADLHADLDLPVDPVTSARNAIEGADIVVTATTSTSPVLPADAIEPGTLVVAVGAYSAKTRELPPGVFDRAGAIFADVPEEVIEIGDLRETGLGVDELLPFGGLLAGAVESPASDALIVVESVGSAVLDVATAEYALDRAIEQNVGGEAVL